MGERERVIDDLADAGVLAAIRWAHRSAHGQLWQDFNPEGGLDQQWVGLTAHKYLVNRQDRVFQCQAYAVPPDADGVGRDVLAAGMRDEDFRSMPLLRPGVVERSDLNGSPGWRFGDWRWLMVSCEYGRVDEIVWSHRSETKDRVARQPYMDDEIGLFKLIELLPPAESLTEDQRLLRNTLVLAHAMDPDNGETELYLGRARSNDDKGPAWSWKVDLLSLSGTAIAPQSSVDVERAADSDPANETVRMRRPARDAGVPRAIGDT